MNVVELLYKLRMLANVEVVVALLPEMVGVSVDAKAEVAAHALKAVSTTRRFASVVNRGRR